MIASQEIPHHYYRYLDVVNEPRRKCDIHLLTYIPFTLLIWMIDAIRSNANVYLQIFCFVSLFRVFGARHVLQIQVFCPRILGTVRSMQWHSQIRHPNQTIVILGFGASQHSNVQIQFHSSFSLRIDWLCQLLVFGWAAAGAGASIHHRFAWYFNQIVEYIFAFALSPTLNPFVV